MYKVITTAIALAAIFFILMSSLLGQRLLRRAAWRLPTSLREGESLQRLTEPALTVGQK